MWPVFTGREDGKVSLVAEVGENLPSANANFTTLLTQFGNKGLDMDDLVILSGIQHSFFFRFLCMYAFIYFISKVFWSSK